jgi:hypothetical protein
LLLPAVAVAVLWLMVPNEYNLKQVLPVVTRFTDTARSGVLPPTTAAAFPWLEATSAGSDPVYGGYYMSSGALRTTGCGLLSTSVCNALLLPSVQTLYAVAKSLGATGRRWP